MNDWLVLYRDGKTPKIYGVTVQAESMVEALQEARARDENANTKNVWACVLRDQAESAASAMLKLAGKPPAAAPNGSRLTMHLRHNEWTGWDMPDTGSARDRELTAAMNEDRTISVDVKGKPVLMRVATKTVNGDVVAFELVEPRS